MPNDVDVESFAELVYLKIIDYTHYKNAIYFRNDRDENGEYISAN
jgi:hypothetical protein